MFQEMQVAGVGGGGSNTPSIPIDIFRPYLTTNASATHSSAFWVDTTGKNTLKIKVQTSMYSPAYSYDATNWTNFTNGQELTLDVSSKTIVYFGFNNNRNQYNVNMQILDFSLI